MARSAILITPKDKKELALLQELIERMGLNGRSLDRDEVEDLGLASLMLKVDRKKKAHTATVLRKLKR